MNDGQIELKLRFFRSCRPPTNSRMTIEPASFYLWPQTTLIMINNNNFYSISNVAKPRIYDAIRNSELNMHFCM